MGPEELDFYPSVMWDRGPASRQATFDARGKSLQGCLLELLSLLLDVPQRKSKDPRSLHARDQQRLALASTRSL